MTINAHTAVMLDDNIIKSNHPKLVACRIFVGNLATEQCTKQDLVDKFEPCGKVLGVAIHKGYAFIQMESETAVDRAVQMCHRTIFKGQAIDVKPKTANEEGAGRFRKRPLEDEREPSGPYSHPFDGPPGGEMYNNYGPDLRQEYMHRGPPPMGPMGPRFGNGPPPPHMDGAPRGPPPHFPGGGPPPHPFGAPPNGPPLGSLQPPRSQFMGGGPPPPGDGPRFGGPPPQQQQQGPPSQNFQPAPPQPLVEDAQAAKRAEYGIERPFDAVIVVTNKNLKHYAEMAERRLLELNMVVDMIFLLNEKALNKAIDDMACRGVLYIIVIQQQHEEHKSITVNIMHGTPQEHRNMPLEDALVMLARDFNAYLSSLRCGSEQPTMGFLLNLLADGKHLSVAELDRIISHLQDRRDRLIEAEGGRKESTGNPNSTLALQQKILSIVSGALSNNGLSNPNGSAQQPAATGPTLPPAATLANMAQQFGINFNNTNNNDAAPKMPTFNMASADPNLAKSIDSLLQNPNILKNLGQPPPNMPPMGLPPPQQQQMMTNQMPPYSAPMVNPHSYGRQ